MGLRLPQPAQQILQVQTNLSCTDYSSSLAPSDLCSWTDFYFRTGQQIWSTDRILQGTAISKNGTPHGETSCTFISSINPSSLLRMQISAF